MDKETALELAAAMRELAKALDKISAPWGGIDVRGISNYVEVGIGPQVRRGGGSAAGNF